MNCDCGALDCPLCNFHMNERRYQLPYVDAGQRRPWVPYHQWVAQREAERMRVPGVLRNDRAFYAARNREFPVPRADMRRAQARARAAREREAEDPEVRREMYERNLAARRAKWRMMHKTARALYDIPHPRGEEEDLAYKERMGYHFDQLHGDYGGRMEEFVFTGQEEDPSEQFERLREDEIADLPVLDPKKVKFVDQ